MSEVEGTRTFQASSAAYDAFMGRYARALATHFADYCLPTPPGRFLDVGCGPGALTGVAVRRLGAAGVAAVDPAPGFVAACRVRHPGVDVRRGQGEELPFNDGEFAASAAQLVFHFVSDPDRVAAEMARVVRPGGTVSAAVWDMAEGMQMLRAFWDAALSLDPDAPDEARVLRFGADGELAGLFAPALDDIEETTATVGTHYRSFAELWTSFLHGIGPAGAYTVAAPPSHRRRLRAALRDRLAPPNGSFRLTAVARMVRGRVPG